MKLTQAALTVMVSDMGRAISFYSSLGFTLHQRYGDHYAEIVAPGMKIGLHPSRSVLTPSDNVSIGLIAESFDAARKELEELGIAYEERSEQGGNFLHFRDPDGTPVYFYEAKGWG